MAYQYAYQPANHIHLSIINGIEKRKAAATAISVSIDKLKSLHFGKCGATTGCVKELRDSWKLETI